MKGLLGELTPTFDSSSRNIEPKYSLAVGDGQTILNDWLGHGVTLTYLNLSVCRHCNKGVRKLYGGGHCYDCFTTLARCDLCVMSPDRCHFHLGTCREPEWGESFCMQPHSVYLSNTSGPKIGITRVGRETRRWLDQGATQALKIISTPTRRAAGLVEAFFKRSLNDRTDWRKMVTGAVRPANLVALAEQLRREVETFGEAFVGFNTGVSMAEEVAATVWEIDSELTEIRYPVASYSPAERLILTEDNRQICDNLQGVIGQYLLMSQGVINLADYRGTSVDVELGDPFGADILNSSDQLSLFD